MYHVPTNKYIVLYQNHDAHLFASILMLNIFIYFIVIKPVNIYDIKNEILELNGENYKI